MSAVVGIDLSSKAIDLVKIDESFDQAFHKRVCLYGDKAWERTLSIPASLPSGEWWDDVYLVAIEAPYGRGKIGTTSVLNRVVGALIGGMPPALRFPERCWIVAPHEWKDGLALKGKPTEDDIRRLGIHRAHSWPVDQDSRDALCLALWARNTNAKAVAAA